MAHTDLVGRTFGELTVLENLGRTAPGRFKYKCRCSCGNIKITINTYLTLGTTKSCGCLIQKMGVVHHERHRPNIGSTFSCWTIIGYEYIHPVSRRWGYFAAVCRCVCGVEKHVYVPDLVKGRNLSCGCLVRTLNRCLNAYRRSLKGEKEYSRKGIQALRCKEAPIMRAVKRHDNKTCVNCSETRGVAVHHIIPLNENPRRAGVPKNMVTLCKKCHDFAHNGNFHGETNKEFAHKLSSIAESREAQKSSYTLLTMPYEELLSNISTILQDL